ncbi:hypothetical protein Ahy_B08g093175 [Arachis hypogaea]|uniref:Uncharacterized protein n=1 Tax=Arachis hypogaea TaxID=3818 RepID=A0A444Y5M3_ARAHY|nr:hypothetical protein Ahy_B08g093175 [Arachis hypogaea]
MRLRSEKIIHMADEMSNVNGGSTTSDSIPVLNGGSNSQNPQQHFEYSRDYNVGSTSNAANLMAVYRQQVEESHHDLVNLLTQQMTTILNPMMADHESKFERLAQQVERIARIVDYDEGERHNARGNNEGFENVFQNENVVVNREIPHVVPRTKNADDFLARLRVSTDRRVNPLLEKKKVAYVTMESFEEEFDFKTEVDLAELKKCPPYVCSLLKKLPSNEKLNDSKLKSGKKYNRDVSLCPRCNAVFDTEAAAIFEKERMKKELAHREEQARQRQPIRHFEGQSSKTHQQSTAAPLSRS